MSELVVENMIKLSLDTKRDRQTETAIKEFLGRADDEGLYYFLICKLSDSYDDVDVNELMKVALESGYGYVDSNDWFTFVKVKTTKYEGSYLYDELRRIKIHLGDDAVIEYCASYNSY